MRHSQLRLAINIAICLSCFINLAQAQPLAECSATNGASQFRMGYQYERGDSAAGISQDYQAAMRYYLAAAQLGNDQAMFRIGYMYDRGLGVAIDKVQAKDFYIRAAAAGSVPANFKLGNVDAAKAISDKCEEMLERNRERNEHRFSGIPDSARADQPIGPPAP
jgi:TPR repeat protein